MCPGYLAEAACPGDGLKVVINLTKEAEQALKMVLNFFSKWYILILSQNGRF